MVESINQFMDRIHVIFPNIPKWGDTGRVFVWNTVWLKENDRNPNETWSISTAQNYLRWLKEQNE